MRIVARIAVILSCGMGILLLSGCAGRSPKPAAPAATDAGQIDQIRLVAVPVALNLDRRPGLDGFGVKVYGLSHSHAKPQAIRRGNIEILMYDGLLPGGTNDVQPRCAWNYPASDLGQYEMISTIGLAYQFAPRWGDTKPTHNRITVIARYKPHADAIIESAPSVITVPAQ
jgi:hypothetical protein